MKMLTALSCVFALAACAPNGPSPGEVAQTRAVEDEFIRGCKARFALAVPRTRCLNGVANIYVRPHYPFPDLLDVMLATRLAVAEKVDAGTMTWAEADLAVAKTNSEILSEASARLNSQAMMRLQYEAAMRAARPVSCYTLGDVTNCY